MRCGSMTIRVPLLVVISKNDWPCQVTVIFLASAAAALPAASTTKQIAINRRDISGTPEGWNESAWMIQDEEAAWQASHASPALSRIVAVSGRSRSEKPIRRKKMAKEDPL